MISFPGFHFGITAHPMQVEDAETEALVMMPYIQGKDMAAKISGYMNVIGYLGKREVERNGVKAKVQTIQFARTGNRYYAKDRFGCLGTYMDSPTLPKVEAKIAAWRQAMKQQQTEVKSAAPVTARPQAQRK